MRPSRTLVVTGALVAFAGFAITSIEAMTDVHRALLAWLAAFGWGVSMGIAALVLAMTLHVTHARWWVALRPALMALVATIPLLAIVFLPIAIGLHHVYPWARSGAPEVTELPAAIGRALEHQRAWNNPTFFLARSAFYFVVWTILVVLLARADRIHRRAPTSELPARFEAQRRVSGAGLPIVSLTASFAAFDWLMSVEPGWVSSAFGLYVFCGGLVTAISAWAIVIFALRARGALPSEIGPPHAHAVGRLVFMAIILWAYIGFFQLLLVWIADIPHESSFFGARARGTFVVVDWVLVVSHFVVPFFLLLSRALKRSLAAVAFVGATLMVASAVDFAWLVMPRAGSTLRLVDAAPFVAVLGVVVAFVARLLGRPSPAPDPAVVDPVLRDSLAYRSP